MLEFEGRVSLEDPMRILVSAAGMVKMAVACFVLGIVLGVYFGVAGSPEAVPPTVSHSVDSVAPVNATAP
jgi:hypothetical protein